MQLDGLHQLFYLGYVAFAVYAALALLAWMDIIESDPVNFRKHPKKHLTALAVFAIFLVFQPIKVLTQSSGERDYHRQSFDTPVYQNDRQAVETYNPSNELSQIKQKQNAAKAEWDSITNNEDK